jgi:hypothetical protein
MSRLDNNLEIELDLQMLRLIAAHTSITDLSLRGRYINGASIEDLRNSVAAPFSSLKSLAVKVTSSDTDTLLSLLESSLAKLFLRVCSDFRPIFLAIARHQPTLRDLNVGYIMGHCTVNAADFLMLNRLSQLEKIALRGLEFNLDVEDWRAAFSGLPNLQHLVIGCAKHVPPETFAIVGQCCRTLQYLSLDAKCQPSDLCRTDHDLPLFPKLQRFFLGSIPLLDGLR